MARIAATYAFVDASNIIYGTRDEGWKVDFKKLIKYLKERYQCRKVYYFGGREGNNSKQEVFYKKLGSFGIANAKRTAKKIKLLEKAQFNDLGSLKQTLGRKK